MLIHDDYFDYVKHYKKRLVPYEIIDEKEKVIESGYIEFNNDAPILLGMVKRWKEEGDKWNKENPEYY